MGWLPESVFRRKHHAWHLSPEAKALKARLLGRQKGLCARCRRPLKPWEAELNLTTYDGMKCGHVTDDQANVLHRSCHRKGTYTWDKLRQDKSIDRWRRAIVWVGLLPVRLPWRLLRLLIGL